MSSDAIKDVTGAGFDTDSLPPFEQGPIDLRGWFGPDRRDLPLELEIGSGKGTFLVQQAQQVTGVNFIGLEYAREYWRHAADRVRRHHLTHVRVGHVEAGFFLRNYVGPGTLHQVHIYFPDPWPKARHHKRRLIQADFLRMLRQRVEDGGRVRIATDHSDYFAWMQEHIAQVRDLWDVEPFETPASAGEGELVGSNFERKYRHEGRPFHAVMLRAV